MRKWLQIQNYMYIAVYFTKNDATGLLIVKTILFKPLSDLNMHIMFIGKKNGTCNVYVSVNEVILSVIHLTEAKQYFELYRVSVWAGF